MLSMLLLKDIKALGWDGNGYKKYANFLPKSGHFSLTHVFEEECKLFQLNP